MEQCFSVAKIPFVTVQMYQNINPIDEIINSDDYFRSIILKMLQLEIKMNINRIESKVVRN